MILKELLVHIFQFKIKFLVAYKVFLSYVTDHFVSLDFDLLSGQNKHY